METKKRKLVTESRLVCVIPVILMIAGYGIYMYSDITNTLDNSVMLLKCITEGHIKDFYEYTVANAQTQYAANYNFFAYILWAVWNIPIFIASNFFGVDYLHSIPCLLWSKGLLIIALVVSIIIMDRIITLIMKDSENAENIKSARDTAVVMFLTSSAMLLSVIMLTQLDIIALVLMLLGLYFMLKGKDRYFIVFFALAMPFKMFAIFLFLPLLFIKEKNIIRIFVKVLCVCVLPIIESILFSGSAMYKAALSSQSRDAIAQLMGPNFASGTCIFFVVYIVVLVYCYFSANISQRDIIYICFLVFGSFVAFSQITTYWIILMLPFLAMLTALNKKLGRFYILIEGIGSFAFFMEEAISSVPLNEDNMLVNRLLIKPITEGSGLQYRYYSVLDMLTVYNIDIYYEAFFSVFMTSMLMLLVLCNPKIADKFSYRFEIKDKMTNIFVYVLRIVLFAVVFFVPIYAYGTTKKEPLYSNIYDGIQSMDVNLIEGEGHTIVQKVKLPYGDKVKTLKLLFYNENTDRNNFASVTIGLYESDNEVCLAEQTFGCSMIESEQEVTLKLKDVTIEENKQYEIRLTGQKGIDNEYSSDYAIYPAINYITLVGEMYLDDEEQQCELCFELGE